MRIAGFETVISKIDYFRAPFKSDGCRAHSACKTIWDTLPKKKRNVRLTGINPYILPEDHVSTRAKEVLWHETLHCPGRNGCTPNPTATNHKHTGCAAGFKLLIFPTSRDYFHIEFLGEHGAGYTVDPAILPVAKEVLIQ